MAEQPGPSASSLLGRAPDVRVRRFRGVLLIARRDDALELDAVAEFIFRRVDGGTTVHAIGEQLAATYGIPVDEAVADSLELLGRLHELGMVRMESPAG
ncbi:PqqD family protein [Streptomyces sp. NPDC002276]